MQKNTELIYFVDENDTPTGEFGEKLTSHTANTSLHAAFSCYIFNNKGALLVSQRSFSKKVWPGVWTNSVCGHPAPGESRVEAIHRRVKQELGMAVTNVTLIVPKYIYKTPPLQGIVEHEYCPIYTAIAVGNPRPNPHEVANFNWLQWIEYELLLQNDLPYNDNHPTWMHPVLDMKDRAHGSWSWWCKDQLKLVSPIIQKSII